MLDLNALTRLNSECTGRQRQGSIDHKAVEINGLCEQVEEPSNRATCVKEGLLTPKSVTATW